MKYISSYDIFGEFDINEGDTILVSSDMSSIVHNALKNKENFDFHKFLDSLKKRVTDKGNILITAYNWDFCKNLSFSYKQTKSETGILGNYAPNFGFKRTKHPIYSHYVYGANSEEFLSIEDMDAFGKNSIFDLMYKNNVKNLCLGLPFDRAYTFIHYFEQKFGVPYRYIKFFHGQYIDENDCIRDAVYSMYVKKRETGAYFHDSFLSEQLLNSGIGKKYVINGLNHYIYDVVKSEELIKTDIMFNDSNSFMKFNEIYEPNYLSSEYIDNFVETILMKADESELIGLLKKYYFGEIEIKNSSSAELVISGISKKTNKIRFNLVKDKKYLISIINFIKDRYNDVVRSNTYYMKFDA